jgi:filamentous hemagglutinin
MHLDPKDYGTGDEVHFNRANKALHEALLADPDFAARMEKLIPGITETVSSKDGRDTPDGYTWHHEKEPGRMRLVPSSQHKPGSTYWKALHPDPKGRGGYALWAIPAGAKPRKPKKK